MNTENNEYNFETFYDFEDNDTDEDWEDEIYND